MSRSLCLLAALLLASAILAAPAPKPFVAGWGNPVDPDSDCKISRDKGALTIEMPGSDHDYDPIRERYNAPRLLREFKGKFGLQVRIQILSRPSKQSTVKGQPSFVSAGFLIVPREEHHPPCRRFEYGIKPEGLGFLARKDRDSKKGRSEGLGDYRWKKWPLPKNSDYAYLRLERLGRGCSCSVSPDGKEWTSIIGMGILPEKIKVGLAAYTTSSEPSKVRFDQLKIKRVQRIELLGGPSHYQVRRP